MLSDYPIYFPLSGEYKRLFLERDQDFSQKVLKKHHKVEIKNRAVCLCSEANPEMQVYLHSNGYYHLKRNPRTGQLHKEDCWSYGKTVESYGRTDFLSAVSLELDSSKKIRVATSLTIADKGKLAIGNEGGIKKSKRKYERTSLRGFFEFLWSEMNLLNNNDGDKIYYGKIHEQVHTLSSTIKYNNTPVNDVLIMPSGMTKKDQKELLNKLSLSNNGDNPKTKILLLGLLNKVEIIGSGRCTIQLWNTGSNKDNNKTIKYFINEQLAQKILKSIKIN